MKIAFFGSPEFAAEILSKIHERFPVSLVVSQPDKRVGRKQILTPTPVKQFTLQKNIPVETPSNLKGFKLGNIDIAIVVSYGLLIPKDLLNQPKFGFINVHYSLLPNYRGASPVQSAIINGDLQTGVTIMKMDEELDHGDIIVQKEIEIDKKDTTESLLSKLNKASIPFLLSVLETIEKTSEFPQTTEQDHSKATFTKKITKQDGFIPFEELRNALQIPSEQSAKIHNRIHGFSPWPGVWTILPNNKRLKLISSNIENNKLSLTEIQLEGKQKTKDTNILKEFLKK